MIIAKRRPALRRLTHGRHLPARDVLIMTTMITVNKTRLGAMLKLKDGPLATDRRILGARTSLAEQLSAAFGSQNGGKKKKEDGDLGRARENAAPSVIERVEKTPATEDEREEVRGRIQLINSAIEVLKTLGVRPKNPKTDFENALAKVYDGIQKARVSLERVNEQVGIGSATKDVMLGHLQSSRKSLESAWKSSGKALVGEFFNPSWLADYENEMNSVGSVVDGDASATDYINSGLVERDAVERALRGVVKKNARVLMETTKRLDLATRVEGILNELI